MGSASAIASADDAYHMRHGGILCSPGAATAPAHPTHLWCANLSLHLTAWHQGAHTVNDNEVHSTTANKFIHHVECHLTMVWLAHKQRLNIDAKALQQQAGQGIVARVGETPQASTQIGFALSTCTLSWVDTLHVSHLLCKPNSTELP